MGTANPIETEVLTSKQLSALKNKNARLQNKAILAYNTQLVSGASDVAANRKAVNESDVYKRLAAGKGFGGAHQDLSTLYKILKSYLTGAKAFPSAAELGKHTMVHDGKPVDITTPKFINAIMRVYPFLYGDDELIVELMESARDAVGVAFGASKIHTLNQSQLLKVIENAVDIVFNLRLIRLAIQAKGERDGVSMEKMQNHMIGIQKYLYQLQPKQRLGYLASLLVKHGAATTGTLNNGEKTTVVKSAAETLDVQKLATLLWHIFVNDVELIGKPIQDTKGGLVKYALHPDVTEKMAISMLNSKDGTRSGAVYLCKIPEVDVSAEGGFAIWAGRQGQSIQISEDGMFSGDTRTLETCINKLNAAEIVIDTEAMSGLALLEAAGL